MIAFRGASSAPERIYPANVGVTCHANEPLKPPMSDLPPIWTNCGLTPRFPELVQRAMKRADKRSAKAEARQRTLGDTARTLASTGGLDAEWSETGSAGDGAATRRMGRERPPNTNRATLFRAVYAFERYHNAARSEVLDPRAKQQLLETHMRAQSRSTMAPSRHTGHASRAGRHATPGAGRRSARATATPHTARTSHSRFSTAAPVPALDLSAARTVRDQFIRARPKTPMDAYLKDDTLALTPRQYLLLSQEHDAQLSGR